MPHTKVLIVHEDPDIGFLLQSIIASKRLKCFVATSFNDVENHLATHSFELVLTDINIDGIFRNRYIEILNEKLPKAKIVVLTDMDHPAIEKELRLLGVEGFIDFPITLSELRQTLII